MYNKLGRHKKYIFLYVYIVSAINIWKEENSTMDIMVEGPRAAQVAEMLHEREVPYSIAVPDVNALYEREVNSITSMLKSSSSISPSSKSSLLGSMNYLFIVD